MKKFILIAIVCVIGLSIASCGAQPEQATIDPVKVIETKEEEIMFEIIDIEILEIEETTSSFVYPVVQPFDSEYEKELGFNSRTNK